MRAARLAAAALLAGGAAAAREPMRFDLFWVPPMQAEALRPVPVLINLPPLWRNGDAAVVLLFDPPPPAARTRALADALLAEGAAVVELEPHAARGFPADPDARAPATSPASLRADLDAAVRGLAEGWTQGLLVAIGHGQAVEVVLEAARDAGTGLTAAIGLAPEGPRFQAGALPPASHGWAQRAPLLCRALARAEGADAAVERRCVATLDPGSPDPAARVSSAR